MGFRVMAPAYSVRSRWGRGSSIVIASETGLIAAKVIPRHGAELMATFSPTDAALEGFRITRERPRVMLIWSLANLVVSTVMALGLIAMFGPMLAEIENVNAGGDDPAQALAMF